MTAAPARLPPRAFRRRTYPGRGRAAQLIAEHAALTAELVLAVRPTARIRFVVFSLREVEIELASLGRSPRHPWFDEGRACLDADPDIPSPLFAAPSRPHERTPRVNDPR